MDIKHQLRDIFPSKWHLTFFITYILLYIFNAILIRFSQRVGVRSYDYDTISVVLFTEVLKLILACGFYLREGNSFENLFKQLYRYRSLALFYLAPATLYCVYNNLSYINLSHYDPTSYYILLQLRIGVTAATYQVIFKRYLTWKQWVSLILLTIGCVIKQLDSIEFSTSQGGTFLNGYLLLIGVQIMCSCLAGVYNEYLLKGEVDSHLMVQNIFMYADSILCNLFAVSFYSKQTALIDLNIFTKPIVLLIIIVNACCGLSTSFFIKTFNSIMKSYTTGIELLLTAVICFFIFAIPLNGFTIISIFVVSYATYMFARNPVITVTYKALTPSSSASSLNIPILELKKVEVTNK
ncbi:hypothetical protein RDWZM_008040 [Blomia tropicalis]|uniref:Uncharacterized protein n=1 Tax=Blomia tropicalis TaxID=40697 RepID=A0A9Q0M1D2_BLOTA|nr:hypothetical protein RDWZM_008040 [Blomia tropicalis]